jgi:Brp/Blh family beta-carotene 15,15'-monooxygenase
MIKYPNVAIVMSFFGLWIDSFLSYQLQLWLGFALIFSFGILHGANDLTLIENINSKKGTIKYHTILLYYLAIVILGASLFYTIPWFALTLFILVSGYHFGEQQWNNQIHSVEKWLKFSFELSYGLVILFLIFYLHAAEVQQIVFAITAQNIQHIHLEIGLKITVAMLLLLGVVLYYKSTDFRYFVFKELFYILVFGIIFKASSLIWGFAIYFIIWHSIPSMQDQIRFLYGKVNFENCKTYFKKAFPYWIVSLIGIVLLYFIFKDQKIFNALFFSFLASITFPHVIVIIKMFDKK